ncbi:MAG: tricorn protease, partial [Algoriphagus sp.]
MKLKNSFLTLLLSFFLLGIGFAQTPPQWMRYPSISPDGSKIVFTYKGDLYTVSSTGGNANQITFHE